jgi:hypothetical protein
MNHKYWLNRLSNLGFSNSMELLEMVAEKPIEPEKIENLLSIMKKDGWVVNIASNENETLLAAYREDKVENLNSNKQPE